MLYVGVTVGIGSIQLISLLPSDLVEDLDTQWSVAL